MIFNMTLLGWLILHRCKFPFFGRVITRDLVHSVGHSPVFKVRTSVVASPPMLTNSAGMLVTPADFPICSALNAAST